MTIQTEQLTTGRWRYLIVQNGTQYGYSMYDYRTEDEARRYGEAFLQAARTG